MPVSVCLKSDCTVAETGKCLELHDEHDECPNFRARVEEVESESSDDFDHADKSESNTPVRLEASSQPARQFHYGFELGTADAAELMRGSYVHLIAVLGSTNAGKTCLLSSLYLMASLGVLKPHFSLAGGLTLQGFEDRARRLRQWTRGVLPDKLSDHTVLSDPRSPAFMHLALRGQGEQATRLNLLLTDLPGEWTADLINRAETAARFEFLKRADGIIFVIEGPRLRSNAERHNEVRRAKQALQRLAKTVGVDCDIPLVLLISQSDKGGMVKPQDVDRIENHAVEFGFNPVTIMAAAFSRDPERVKSGTGVMEAINVILNHETPPQTPAPDEAAKPLRSFARFRVR